MRRVGFLAFVVWCAGIGAAQAATLPVRPNILWLIIEDACPDFGCYGNKSVRTPNIDQFATESRRFTRAFATASVCSPSRSAFMTGRDQTAIGAHHHRSHRQDGFHRPADVRLITERMREAGYFTVNLRSLPPELGFSGAAKTDWNFHDDGRAFDGDKWADLKGRQPFYAQLNFQQTHRPYRKAEDNPVDPASVDLPGYLADDPVIRADWAAYLDEVGRVDAKAGVVLRRLEQDGLRDNTAVFFSPTMVARISAAIRPPFPNSRGCATRSRRGCAPPMTRAAAPRTPPPSRSKWNDSTSRCSGCGSSSRSRMHR
ncbi:MAG: sulfatase-like hydrolase/transferase [Opitutaceae bacterium]|nr:sulfatase-like hydrolase/transferase [Opitutaceae bacterium]